MRRLADGVMTRLASVLTHVFFRHVEIEGGENLPRHGPLVVVANHTNGLVDGLLLMATLRRYPRFLAKSTLFRIIPLRPFLKLAGVVPVYRRSDSDGEHGGGPLAQDRNEVTFRTSRELLARGGVVALFPEGISHNEPALQPLRTGAARIALGAAEQSNGDGATVAVGLVYDAKATFRSRALVRVGRPRPVAPWVGPYHEDSRAAVRALTDDMTEQLHEVVTTYRSWQDADLLAAIADLIAAPMTSPAPAAPTGDEPPGPPDASPSPLEDRERIAAALAAIDLDSSPDGRALKEAFLAYGRELALMGVTDAQVTAPFGRQYRAAMAWSLFKVALMLPPGLVGAAIHAIPYQIMKRVGNMPHDESIKSTVKLLGCFAAFNVDYLVLAEVVRRKRGLLAATIALFAAPLSGYAALRLSERAKAAGGLLEGGRIVRSRRVLLPTVLDHRADVVRRACELVAARSGGAGLGLELPGQPGMVRPEHPELPEGGP